jgi:hypothetical protein
LHIRAYMFVNIATENDKIMCFTFKIKSSQTLPYPYPEINIAAKCTEPGFRENKYEVLLDA